MSSSLMRATKYNSAGGLVYRLAAAAGSIPASSTHGETVDCDKMGSNLTPVLLYLRMEGWLSGLKLPF